MLLDQVILAFYYFEKKNLVLILLQHQSLVFMTLPEW